MKKPDESLPKRLTPEEELEHFKAVIRNLMIDASKVLAYMELLSRGAELEE